LIVFPHGGPWARDEWGYQTFAQFFANRGYAVLQPNFRGSTGYGKKFLNAGNGQWGRKMQDDLTWGVKYLIAQGTVNPKRVGIAGGSYGGYATLAGVAFTPDVYAAAVSIVGPSNLITLLGSIPPYWEAGRRMMYSRMADPDTPEGKKVLQEESPLTAAAQIKTPLMVVQGANDPRVNKRESDQIVVALRDRGISVVYLVAPDEGHGFARPINNLAMITEMERFLAQHLDSRFQESVPADVAARLKEITVDPKTVTVAPKQGAAQTGSPVPGEDLTPGLSKYKATLDASGQSISLELSSEIKEDSGLWAATDTVQTPMGPVIDTATLEKRTLVPRRRHVTQGEMTIDVNYKAGKASGTITMNGLPKPIQVDLGGPLFADSAGSMESIATLPLSEGYRTTFRNFDLQSQKPRVMQLTVADAERVTVPAGTFQAYKVVINSQDGVEKMTMWVAKTPKRTVKYQAVMPEMGGATLTAELLP
jgi:dienelactone hydrolase